MADSRFDIDLREGLLREGALRKVLGDRLIEVKSQVDSQRYGYVFIEYESRGYPSGMAVTEATDWAIEVGPDRWVIVPVRDLSRMAIRALRLYGTRVGGDDKTSKGAIVPRQWLLDEVKG